MSEAVTVEQLDLFIEKLTAVYALADEKGEELKALNKEIAKLEGQAVAMLKELDRKNYQSPHGTISVVNKWRVNLPEDDHAKRELFAHLRERGIFDKYATVNSNSLNALYMKDWEAAKEIGEGMTFSMPGIGPATLFESMGFRKAK